MPDPISAKSVLDSASSFEPADGCDPSVSSCLASATSAAPSSDAARSVTIGPVYVTGDSGAGARELVRRHESSSSQACGSERHNAAVSCMLAASAAVGTIALTPTGIGLVMGAVTATGLSIQCARDLSAAMDCKDQTQALAEMDSDCAELGGISLLGTHGELVCLVMP